MSNKQVSLSYFEIYGNHHDVEGCTPLFTEDAVFEGSAGQWQQMGLPAYEALSHAFLEGFPDITVDVGQQVEEGDTVVTIVTWKGTHTGPLEGLPATGKPIQIEGIFVDRFRDGRIAWRLEVSDNMKFARQLGLVPPSQQG